MDADNGNATVPSASLTSGTTRIRSAAHGATNRGATTLFFSSRLQRLLTNGRLTAIKFANVRVQFARRYSLCGWRVFKDSIAKLRLFTGRFGNR